MVECEAVLEYVVTCFLRGECKKCEVLINLRLCEAHEFELPPGVVALSDNCFKNVEGVLMSE